MKVNNAQSNILRLEFDDDANAGGKYNGYFYLTHSTSNCKLTTLDYIACIGTKTDAQKKYMIDAALKHCRVAIHIHTIQKPIADFIKKHYTIYTESVIPIGYNGGYQYHLIIRNPNAVASGYNREPIIVKAGVVDKDSIGKKLLAILKRKRRKNDYVNEFLESI